MRKMDNRSDFLQRLGPDMSIEVFDHLDDPSDLVRASSVSNSWHRFGKIVGLRNLVGLGLTCSRLLGNIFVHFHVCYLLVYPCFIGLINFKFSMLPF